MKNINENPYEFFKDGGWSFLGGVGGDRNSDSESSVSEESEFNMSDGEEASSESESESDFSGGSASDSGSASASMSDESGEDWDELERKALKCEQYDRDFDGFHIDLSVLS